MTIRDQILWYCLRTQGEYTLSRVVKRVSPVPMKMVRGVLSEILAAGCIEVEKENVKRILPLDGGKLKCTHTVEWRIKTINHSALRRMLEKPKPEPRLRSEARDKMWQAARIMCNGFTLAQIAEVTGAKLGDVSTYIGVLQRNKYVIKSGGRYRLVVNPGPKRPGLLERGAKA